MTSQIIVDGETGEVRRVDLTPAEAAALATDQAIVAASQQKADGRDAFLQSIRPGATILGKIRDGTALTAAETQALLRYLGARAYLGEVAP